MISLQNKVNALLLQNIGITFARLHTEPNNQDYICKGRTKIDFKSYFHMHHAEHPDNFSQSSFMTGKFDKQNIYNDLVTKTLFYSSCVLASLFMLW